MSLYIDVDRINRVLLSDQWLPVTEGSFDLDSYEYQHEGQLLHGGGSSGVCSTGFAFKVLNGDWVAGPLTAIQAVQYKESGTA
ncbi:hypothetical protein ACPYPG_21145 [Streptomyces sp. FR-108]|uniref:hypothetical protein n=1 Tax=Streptomyces sp. FR-108 TaxID=3416665 RepID=UPI003CFB66AC